MGLLSWLAVGKSSIMEHIFLRIPLLTRCFANADSQKMVNDFSFNVFVTFHDFKRLDVH